jgi:hypothetical protein
VNFSYSRMKKKLLLGFVIGLMVAMEGMLIYGVELVPEMPLTPSRVPMQGSQWKEVVGHGMRLLTQDDGVTRMVVVEDGFAIQNETGVALKPTILVIEKPWLKPSKKVIADQFISALSEEAQRGCAVAPLKRGREGVRRFTIVPETEEYLAAVEKKMELFDEVVPCGAYGVGNGKTYFEYHDTRPGQLLFVRIGQGRAIFDEQSLMVN